MADASRTRPSLDRQVLDCLRHSRVPLSAYQIREAVDAVRSSGPALVYRALQRLVDRGLVHRVASLRAFVACDHPRKTHSPVLNVCLACRTVQEAPLCDEDLDAGSSSLGTGDFLPDQIEIHIRCESCRSAS